MGLKEVERFASRALALIVIDLRRCAALFVAIHRCISRGHHALLTRTLLTLSTSWKNTPYICIPIRNADAINGVPTTSRFAQLVGSEVLPFAAMKCRHMLPADLQCPVWNTLEV